jgi:pilus assembly protein CpaE
MMRTVTRALVAIDQGVDARTLETAIAGVPSIQLVGSVEGLDGSWAALEETAADLLVVACNDATERALYLIEGAAKQRPDRPIVVFYGGPPNGFMQRAFAAGADDLVMLPETDSGIRFALEKVIARRKTAATGTAAGRMICVLGPKGGTGKTLTASNLVVALATAGKRAVVVDLDLQFGDMGIVLGLAPDRTVYDLARAGGTIDAEKVEAFLLTHESGARALLAPSRPDQAAAVTPDFLREVYAGLRTTFEYVVVDTSPGFTPEVIASIDSSSDLCVVAMLDALSLKDTRLGLETLDLMGYDSGRISLVLNRADTQVGISRDDARKILGRDPDVLVPSDREIPRSVTQGEPIVLARERSGAARAFRALATVYTADDGADAASLMSNGNAAAAGGANGRRSIGVRVARLRRRGR